MYGETVTRQRAPLVLDPYSGENIRADWDDEDNPPAEIPIDGCAFNPGGSSEPTEVGRQAVITRPTVYTPYGADITAVDRLVVRGNTYAVAGDPAQWRSPFTGWEPGLAVELERVEG